MIAYIFQSLKPHSKVKKMVLTVWQKLRRKHKVASRYRG